MNSGENKQTPLLEDVDKTIADISEKRDKRNEKNGVLTALKKISVPFAKLGKRVNKLLSSMTARAVITYFLLTLFSLVLLSIVVLSTVKAYLFDTGADAQMFYYKLLILTVALDLFIVVAITFCSYLIMRFSFAPLRKMTKQIKSITANDLSKRLDEEASASELINLAGEINKLLEDMSHAFDRQKKFVSDASHELKTPIAVIQGYTALLQRWGKADEKVLDESLDSIAREAENMKNLVDRLLFLARIGQYLVDKKQVEIDLLLERIAQGYEMSHTNRKISVHCPKIVFSTDESLLTECLRAIIDNAIKYSDEDDCVEIFAKRENKSLEITVKDYGVGIKQEDLQRIFDRFYRCDSVRGRDENSCGLGLTICASIMEILGGSIKVESVLKEGTEVKIILGGENG